MVAAHQLHADHDICVFEAGAQIGGHTHTVDVEQAGKRYAVDTGFIVFNDWTYPNFIKLLDELAVPWQPSLMSFSVRCERSGLEYNGTSINTLFAQRRNLLRPSFYGMIADILRFNRDAPQVLAPQVLAPYAASIELGEYLDANGYSRAFVENYIMPMGAAIWSSSAADMRRFPMRFFVEFFSNHGFLNVDHRPVWRVIKGGSREYATRLTASFANKIRLRTAVAGIHRREDGVVIRLANGSVEAFDQVVIACHSDQALALLADPSVEEREILGAIRYQSNEVALHTDIRQLPRRKLAWAAWNYHLPLKPTGRATVTYNMNVLQSLDAPVPFLVTLNRTAEIDPQTILGYYTYDHPIFSTDAVAAQRRRAEISGVRRTYYCGAYWSYGFHEDGVNSGLAAAAALRQNIHAQPYLQRVG